MNVLFSDILQIYSNRFGFTLKKIESKLTNKISIMLHQTVCLIEENRDVSRLTTVGFIARTAECKWSIMPSEADWHVTSLRIGSDINKDRETKA